ncbi:VWA domain-containing protein, partial [Nitratireductor sp. ZSWI3]|nr:VWA domain-containing protein [Nitratireductor sp. ZSWI3]
QAGRLGLVGVPVFVFQEGHDPLAERAFREIARLSKGAWFRLDSHSAAELGKLLAAVAVYATGGLKALTTRDRPEDRLMLEHLRGKGQ